MYTYRSDVGLCCLCCQVGISENGIFVLVLFLMANEVTSICITADGLNVNLRSFGILETNVHLTFTFTFRILPKVHCRYPCQMQLQVAMGTAACTLRPDVYGDVIIVTDGSPGVLVFSAMFYSPLFLLVNLNAAVFQSAIHSVCRSYVFHQVKLQLQEQQERARREMGEERLRLQQLKV